MTPRDAAEAARRAFEPLWADWHARMEAGFGRSVPVVASAGMCRLTSAALAGPLSRATGIRWRPDGGDCWPCAGGYRDDAGRWHGHYWLTAGVAILDLTADQFGGEAVTLTEAGDPRYAANYGRHEMREHMADARTTAAAWRREVAGALRR